MVIRLLVQAQKEATKTEPVAVFSPLAPPHANVGFDVIALVPQF